VATKPLPLSREALSQMVDQNQQFLTQQAAHDFHSGGSLGGGIASATSVIGQEISHLTGAGEFMDWVGHINKPKKYASFDAQVAAFLTDMTYKTVDERPDKAMMYERLSKYDTEHCSVWRNRDTQELMVTVRGTKKMSASDLKQDFQILVGGVNVENVDFRNVLDKLNKDYPNQKYNIAAHSLGCQYVLQEAARYGEHWDESFLFSVPSSPAQDDKVLRDRLNNYGLDFYQSHGDIMGQNTNYMFNNDTLDDHVTWGPYRWDPVSSHGLSQWVPESFYKPGPDYSTVDRQESTMDTAVHMQDNEVSQADNLS
jgi:hypothetical protein